MAYRQMPGGGWFGGLEPVDPNTPPRQKRYPGEPNVDPGGYIPTDEERAAEREQMNQWYAANGIPPSDPNAPPPTRTRVTDPFGALTTPGDMHNPGWGVERGGYTPWTPDEAMAQLGPEGQFAPPVIGEAYATQPTPEQVGPPPVASSMPAQFYERGGGQSGYGGGSTLGGAVGMGGGGLGMGRLAGGSAGALRGMFGLGGGGGQSQTGAWGGFGNLQNRQSPTPYVTNRPSPTPYVTGRPSPTPYQGSGYSTLGSVGGYGRQRY